MIALFDIPGYVHGTREVAALLRKHKRLILLLTKRDLLEPYVGQLFGRFWIVGHPLFLMAVYTIIFSLIFETRIGGTHDMPLDYTSYILSGLVPWMTFQQGMSKGVQAVSSNSALVKQLVFPVEVLPVRACLSSMIVLATGVLFLLAYNFLMNGVVYWSYLLLVPLGALTLGAMAGVAFALSAVAVFIRDVRDLVQLFVIVNIYIMPIIYLPSWVPELFQPLLYVNPFSYMVWCYQDALYYGRIEHPLAWCVFALVSAFFFAGGYRVFRKLKPYFGNAL